MGKLVSKYSKKKQSGNGDTDYDISIHEAHTTGRHKGSSNSPTTNMGDIHENINNITSHPETGYRTKRVDVADRVYRYKKLRNQTVELSVETPGALTTTVLVTQPTLT